jgi:hypothetical protein
MGQTAGMRRSGEERAKQQCVALLEKRARAQERERERERVADGADG